KHMDAPGAESLSQRSPEVGGVLVDGLEQVWPRPSDGLDRDRVSRTVLCRCRARRQQARADRGESSAIEMTTMQGFSDQLFGHGWHSSINGNSNMLRVGEAVGCASGDVLLGPASAPRPLRERELTRS